jgi:pimeloyl-ACP methyl ester carboxylesterase
MKQLVKIFSLVFPNLATNYAYKQLTNPQLKKLRPNEVFVLEKAEKEIFEFKDFKIQTYKWPGGEKKVLLIHGWEGQTGNFSDLINILVAQDYKIYAFDAPSHGYSTKGKTSLFEFAELAAILIKRFEVNKIVSHSFGSVATTYALYKNQDISIDNYVLLTTPDTFLERIDDVFETIGLTEKVKYNLIKRIENESNVEVKKLSVSEFVKKIKVKKALIIHDTHDKVIPIDRALNVYYNWINCSLHKVNGTGHFKILRTPEVLEIAIRFLNG